MRQAGEQLEARNRPVLTVGGGLPDICRYPVWSELQSALCLIWIQLFAQGVDYTLYGK